MTREARRLRISELRRKLGRDSAPISAGPVEELPMKTWPFLALWLVIMFGAGSFISHRVPWSWIAWFESPLLGLLSYLSGN